MSLKKFMNNVKCYLMRISPALALLFLFGLLPLSSLARTSDQRLPLVIGGSLPLYPITARAARIWGVVKIKVTTDGKKVTSVETESGPPMLVKFAKENILTWKFTEHKPTTFVTTFKYVLEEPAQCDYSNDSLVLKLPLEVRISAKELETCDPGR